MDLVYARCKNDNFTLYIWGTYVIYTKVLNICAIDIKNIKAHKGSNLNFSLMRSDICN